tara:strand:+ start:1937 stop:2176 length:240 start_codon:yes stop_codon:yes gene_type:complete
MKKIKDNWFGNPLPPNIVRRVFMNTYKHRLDKKPKHYRQLTVKATWDDLSIHIKQLETAKKPYYIHKHHGGKISIWTEK